MGSSQASQDQNFGEKLVPDAIRLLGGVGTCHTGRTMALLSNPMIIAPYDGYAKPSLIELFTFEIWARIVELPIAYHVKVKALSSKIRVFVD